MEPNSAQRASPDGLARHSVLIVDDDVASVELLGHLLEDEGFEVWKAHTGTQARQRLAEQLPDLVLMDVMLPDVDGRELCRELKSAERKIGRAHV